MAKHGKIAHLPRAIRDEVNRRLSDGETGRGIVQWLNALPEVQAVLARDFEAAPINDTNLHEWKDRGYRSWLIHQDTLKQAAEFAADATDLEGVAPGRLSDHLAVVLTARIAAELSEWTGNDDPELRARLKILRELARDVADLRRGDHEVTRLQMEETRLERERDKTEADIVRYFRRWAEFPKVREALLAGAPLPRTIEDPLFPVISVENKQSPLEDAQGN